MGDGQGEEGKKEGREGGREGGRGEHSTTYVYTWKLSECRWVSTCCFQSSSP